MRKFFALALAVAMVLSLASVSFAAADGINDIADVDLSAGPYRYDADGNKMIKPAADNLDASGNPTDALRYGSGVYYLIRIEDAEQETDFVGNYAPVSVYKEIEKLKAKAEFEMGEDLVESVSIVKKYVQAGLGVDIDGYIANDGYYYFVEFKIASKDTTSEADIIATLEFNRKANDEVDPANASNNGIGKIKDDEEDVEFTVFYADTWITNEAELKVTTDVEDLKWDTNYALKFDEDDEVELSFGSANDGNNEGTFTVDVSGQGKVFLKYNTKANEAIAAANPGVEMDFISFNNVKFNRVGEFVYEMDDIVAAYKVVDDKLVEIKGAEMDSDSVTFNTRVLESYVFATAELVNPAAAVEAPVVEAPAVTNPSTGA